MGEVIPNQNSDGVFTGREPHNTPSRWQPVIPSPQWVDLPGRPSPKGGIQPKVRDDPGNAP